MRPVQMTDLRELYTPEQLAMMERVKEELDRRREQEEQEEAQQWAQTQPI